ncbi:DNA polymerase IV [Pseudoalteromonas sp. MMG005]|uniref:DNA polymerase IV n=1 Tax=Pseudoalteromonas sp. MMG005 TaxID=2822682 RepID=UPI001B3A3CDE|nr:DNA polymerase IV [Pseudoalteromonas sp. MMG005]MBQ4845698.1 DNA polymerase IV [Pseudoalteromonas sp. MMG005]
MRKFIHIDMDCFYAAVEMRDNPELANVPMAIGGNSHRGVLSTANYLAREFGVRSAMSNYQAKKLCPNLVIVPGRMPVYKEASVQIRAVFSKYTDLIEPLSLDEAYLDVTDSRHCAGSATLIAEKIRADIFDATGLTASAGVAPIKFLAKIASDENKPNGQFVITPSEVGDFIDTLALKKIPGVGKVTQQKLQAMGLAYGKDIKACEEHFLTQRFGKFGGVLWRRCQGIDERGVETHRVRKSVGVETTFSEDTSEFEILKARLVNDLLPELNRRAVNHIQERGIAKLGVKVKFFDFQQVSKECQFDVLDANVLCNLLNELLARYRHKPVRLIGIQIGLLDSKHSQPQLGLFDLD